MTDYSELKRLAEAFPANLDWDSNEVPFSLHPEYGVVGGESDGTYTVFGEPFRLAGEDFDYDGPIYVSQCGLDFAKFMVAARDGVLALIAENERLHEAKIILEIAAGQVANAKINVERERDQLKAENEALRKKLAEPDPMLIQCLDDAIAEHDQIEKDAARYRWLESKATSIDYDGGMSSVYSLPRPQRSNCGCAGLYPAFYHSTLGDAIDAAMAKEPRP